MRAMQFCNLREKWLLFLMVLRLLILRQRIMWHTSHCYWPIHTV